MKTKLITALRTCAKALEQGTFEYKWAEPQSCNCGIVACALMGKSVAEMKDILQPMRTQVEHPNWKYLVGKFCPITGTPTNEVFKSLLEAGMSQTDIVELEELSNKKVLSRITLEASYLTRKVPPGFIGRLLGKKAREVESLAQRYTSKNNAIAYMVAWADLLTEEGALDVATKETEHAQAPYQ